MELKDSVAFLLILTICVIITIMVVGIVSKELKTVKPPTLPTICIDGYVFIAHAKHLEKTNKECKNYE